MGPHLRHWRQLRLAAKRRPDGGRRSGTLAGSNHQGSPILTEKLCHFRHRWQLLWPESHPRPMRSHKSFAAALSSDKRAFIYQARSFAKACRKLGIEHIRTKPYTPKTNGKAERFIQTALREWAYAQAHPTSMRRAHELPIWMHRYNWHRPHGSLKSKPPISRLALGRDNLLRLHS